MMPYSRQQMPRAKDGSLCVIEKLVLLLCKSKNLDRLLNLKLVGNHFFITLYLLFDFIRVVIESIHYIIPWINLVDLGVTQPAFVSKIWRHSWIRSRIHPTSVLIIGLSMTSLHPHSTTASLTLQASRHSGLSGSISTSLPAVGTSSRTSYLRPTSNTRSWGRSWLVNTFGIVADFRLGTCDVPEVGEHGNLWGSRIVSWCVALRMQRIRLRSIRRSGMRRRWSGRRQGWKSSWWRAWERICRWNVSHWGKVKERSCHTGKYEGIFQRNKRDLTGQDKEKLVKISVVTMNNICI